MDVVPSWWLRIYINSDNRGHCVCTLKVQTTLCLNFVITYFTQNLSQNDNVWKYLFWILFTCFSAIHVYGAGNNTYANSLAKP